MARKTFNRCRGAGMSILDSKREEECLVHCKILIFWIRTNDTFRKKTLGLQCSLKKFRLPSSLILANNLFTCAFLAGFTSSFFYIKKPTYLWRKKQYHHRYIVYEVHVRPRDSTVAKALHVCLPCDAAACEMNCWSRPHGWRRARQVAVSSVFGTNALFRGHDVMLTTEAEGQS